VVKPADAASLPPNVYNTPEEFAAVAAAGQSGPVLADLPGLIAGAHKVRRCSLHL